MRSTLVILAVAATIGWQEKMTLLLDGTSRKPATVGAEEGLFPYLPPSHR